MSFNWDNFLKGKENIDNNTVGQFQQFIKNGGINNIQNQMSQIQQMMQMMNCKNPKEFATMIAKQNGISDKDLEQMVQMAQNMIKK